MTCGLANRLTCFRVLYQNSKITLIVRLRCLSVRVSECHGHFLQVFLIKSNLCTKTSQKSIQPFFYLLLHKNNDCSNSLSTQKHTLLTFTCVFEPHKIPPPFCIRHGIKEYQNYAMVQCSLYEVFTLI